MKGGWFVGDFLPVCLKTSECEVACKHYKKGDAEEAHVHKIATEITLLVEGLVKMNDVIYKSGDIIVLEPGDATDFHALKDTTNVVVKVPSVAGDKYPA
jgi:quercetin dioxygenase-like cupin family protein